MSVTGLEGLGETAQAIKGIVGMFFPDKTADEQNKLAATIALLQQQTDIDKAEAQSTDPLQHWRGGLGWVCVAGYLYAFLIQPIGHTWIPAMLPMDLGQLSALTMGMLGLGGLHVAERIKGAT